uniref:HAT C-terminal dimerisation domain-containing protein n=1 Tax=Meloidogyne incognita TaxID=6306 RepID=A0A914NUQ0_MELIC
MSGHIWNIGLFKRINNNEAECIKCKENGESKYLFKLSERSVKSLIAHVRSKIHKDSENAKQFEKLVNKEQTNVDASIDKYFQQHSSGNLSQLDKKVINLIACENLPFRLVNSPWFHSIVNQHCEKLKDESHYRKCLIDVYEAVKIRITSELKSCTFLSFTTDIWSNKSNAFISLTAQGISNGWALQNYTLAIREFSEAHTGTNISKMLNEILSEWNIKNETIHAFVTDSASNMMKAFDGINNLGRVRLSCGAHMLNRAVQQCFGSKTVEEPVEELSSKTVEEPVEELSLLLCKSRISVQIPYAKAIVSTLCRLDLRVDTENGPREIIEIETMREKLIEEIKSRFFTLQDDKIHSISMFIDPRFKAEFADDKQIFILRVKSWLNEQKNADDLDDNIVVDDFCEPVTDSPPTKRTLLDAVTDLVKNSTKEPVNDEEIDVEIQKYLGQGCIEQNADPLEWWSVNAGTFKSLAQVAKKYLTAPSTSIESEQLFSTARDLYDYRRYNITPKNGEMLLFLNKAI